VEIGAAGGGVAPRPVGERRLRVVRGRDDADTGRVDATDSEGIVADRRRGPGEEPARRVDGADLDVIHVELELRESFAAGGNDVRLANRNLQRIRLEVQRGRGQRRRDG